MNCFFIGVFGVICVLTLLAAGYMIGVELKK